MSWKAIQHAFEMSAEMTATEHHVLLALAYFANLTTGESFPSTQTIANKTHLSKRRVSSALANLRDAGLVIVARRATQHKPTVYKLCEAGFRGDAPSSLNRSETQTTSSSSANHVARDDAPSSEPLLTNSEPNNFFSERNHNHTPDAATAAANGCSNHDGDSSNGTHAQTSKVAA